MGRNKAGRNGPPLQGCIIALSGTFPGHTHSTIETDLIHVLGASLSKTVNEDTTHLVTSTADFGKPSAKVKQAKSHDVCIVKLSWLEDCLDQSTRLTEGSYGFDAPDDGDAPTVNNSKANGSRKRTTCNDAEGDQLQPQPKKKSKAASANGDHIQSQDSSQSAAAVGTESEAKVQPVDGHLNVVKGNIVNVPLDETCPLTHYRIYIDEDSVIYDASLNQTNASNNNNKFYRLQLLHSGPIYKTWTRWGRVGERGQSSILGDGSLGDALRQFDSKFKSKTGLAWAERGANPKPNKYTFVERSYEDTDGEENSEAEEAKQKSEAPESNLHPSIQTLMELIFNQQYFAATMSDLNYDVNKLPLGKLSKNTITRGYQALKDLSTLINDHSLARSEYGTTFHAAAEQLSNSFYSLIPHAFGRNRPPIIQSEDMLKKEVELLDSLSDMKEASNIMKSEPKDIEKINALDRQFRGLNLDEMTPLRKDSTEFNELKNYLLATRGATHNANYQIAEIFRIERQGESERFNKSPFGGPPRDRRLLWHGSRCTNFGGILSQGLRIAPPEAPVSGYMFGKGIYLADMSSKSANYCFSHTSNGHALLLLCEAELGVPIQTLIHASYNAGEDAKANGMISTWGQGTTGPSVWKDAECVHPALKGVKMPDTTIPPGPTNVENAYLLYNEYITYDVAQVRLRYLFQVKM